MAEQAGAGFAKLVQYELRAGELGEGGEEPRASRGLQHDVGQCEPGRDAGDEGERQRCRELLKALGFLGASRLRGHLARETRQHRQQGARRAALGLHRAAVSAQEQDLSSLAGIVGVLPGPGARVVRGSEGRLHGGAKRLALDRTALAEDAGEVGRDLEQLGGGNRAKPRDKRKRARGARRGMNAHVHGRKLRERDGPIRRSWLSLPSGPHPGLLGPLTLGAGPSGTASREDQPTGPRSFITPRTRRASSGMSSSSRRLAR